MLILSATNSFAQRNLFINDVTSELSVFSGKDNEAGIVLSCPANIELTFESTHEKAVDVYKKEMKGDEMFYYMRFNTGKKFRGRKLTIRAEGFNPIIILAELSPKEAKELKLVDPDAEFVFGCYYEYRKRGNEFFEKSMYTEAKENYLIAQSSSDCPVDSNLGELIANVDSIYVWMDRAEEAVEVMDYTTAIQNYANILALNPNDDSIREKRNRYHKNYSTEYKKYYDMAEVYKSDGDYEKALVMYEKVINSQYSSIYTDTATEEAKRMRILIQERKQHVNVFLYEYSAQTPIGISYGKYKNRKAAAYFNLSIHPDVLLLARNQYDECTDAEFNFTPLGINFCLVPKYPHFWMFAGVGYTGVAKYENKDGSIYMPGTYTEGDETKPKLALYSAVSPEAGLLFKVWRVALRYTYQYRYALKAEYVDHIPMHRHTIGLGFTF